MSNFENAQMLKEVFLGGSLAKTLSIFELHIHSIWCTGKVFEVFASCSALWQCCFNSTCVNFASINKGAFIDESPFIYSLNMDLIMYAYHSHIHIFLHITHTCLLNKLLTYQPFHVRY